MLLKIFKCWIVSWSLLSVMIPMSSHALSQNAKFVIRTSGYGALGGTLMGLASYPIIKSGRSVFMGSSIGLYLGALAGLYAVLNKEQNPLGANQIYQPEYTCHDSINSFNSDAVVSMDFVKFNFK